MPDVRLGIEHAAKQKRVVIDYSAPNVKVGVTTYSLGSVFHVTPTVSAFANLFTDLVRRAGLPRIRLHDLRHSYATAALG